MNTRPRNPLRAVSGPLWARLLALVLVGILAACATTPPVAPPTPGPGSSQLPAPSNIEVVVGDESATVSWETVDDPKVAGYHVYVDGQRVTDEPVAAPSGSALQAAARRLSYHVAGLQNGRSYEFGVTTVEVGGLESVLPKLLPVVPKPGAAEIMVNPLTPQGATPNSLPAGAQREIFFEVQKAGKIRLHAGFSGTQLALILNGPGQLGYYARVDGAGPLDLEYTVTAADLLKGTAWRARLVNFSNTPAQNVRLDIDRPFVTGPGSNIDATTLTGPGTPVGATPNSLPAGAQRELFFEVQRPGLIEATVEFSGTDLAVILNGPRQLGYYQRVDGPGPLHLSYNVTAADLQKGTAWRLRVVNFSNTSANDVHIRLEHPNVATLTPGQTQGQILTNPLTPVGATPNSLPAGDRREVFFEVRRPGTITVDASFTGTNLALILNGPDQVGYYQRVDGAGPLHLSYNVTAADVAKGTSWRLSLVNFSNIDAQDVLIDIRYPTVIYGVQPEPKKPGGSWGDPHLVTFDGLKYDFQPVGEFVLVESTSSDFEVQVRQQPWGSSRRVSVNTAVAARVDGHRIGFYLSSPPRIDGVATPIADGATVPLGGGSVQRSGDAYVVHHPDGSELKVAVTGSHMNLYLQLPTGHSGQVRGLLGDFDGATGNDIALRGGPVLSQPVAYADLIGPYADSWRISNAESLFDYAPGESTATFTDLTFPDAYATTSELTPAERAAAEAVCTAAGVTDPILLEACILDVALTGEHGFAQSAAEAQQPVSELELALPDLIVVRAAVAVAQVCEPYQPALIVTATVKNIGNAASPARNDVGLVNALDTDGSGWGNGVGLPSLAPGASTTVSFPIYYLIADPTHMVGSHAFDVTANRGHWIAESDTSNNRLSPDPVVDIPPTFCGNMPARVALLHGKDASAATAYEAGLEANGIGVTLVAIGSSESKDAAYLARFDLLLIDTFSGYLDAWDGDDLVRAAIARSKRPVLGLGEGGYAYLGTLGLPLGWPNGWHGSGFTGFETTTPLHPSLVGPRPVSLAGGRLAATTDPMSFVAIYLPSPAASLQLVGRQDGDKTHYPAAVDAASRTGIWGAHGLPSYTDDGWDALANLINHMAALP